MGDTSARLVHSGEDPRPAGDILRQSILLILRAHGELGEYDAGHNHRAGSPGYCLLYGAILLLRMELLKLRHRGIERAVQVSR